MGKGPRGHAGEEEVEEETNVGSLGGRYSTQAKKGYRGKKRRDSWEAAKQFSHHKLPTYWGEGRKRVETGKWKEGCGGNGFPPAWKWRVVTEGVRKLRTGEKDTEGEAQSKQASERQGSRQGGIS